MNRRALLAGLAGALGAWTTSLAAAKPHSKKRRKAKAEDHDTTWKWRNRAPKVVNYLPNELYQLGWTATDNWKAATGSRLCLTRKAAQYKQCEDGVLPASGEIAICWSNQRVGKSGTTQLYFEADGVTIGAALIKVYGPITDPYLAWTIPHELGHAIGLQHSALPMTQTVMADVYHSTARKPLSHDIAVATNKYKANPRCL